MTGCDNEVLIWWPPGEEGLTFLPHDGTPLLCRVGPWAVRLPMWVCNPWFQSTVAGGSPTSVLTNLSICQKTPPFCFHGQGSLTCSGLGRVSLLVALDSCPDGDQVPGISGPVDTEAARCSPYRRRLPALPEGQVTYSPHRMQNVFYLIAEKLESVYMWPLYTGEFLNSLSLSLSSI